MIKVINGRAVLCRKPNGGYGMKFRFGDWTNETPEVTSHEPWRKVAAYKNKRLKKQK